jgi:hypothetical protein
MTSLQQVVQASLGCDVDCTVLAVHRRSMTLLVGGEESVYPTRQDDTGKWLVFSAFTIPASMDRIIGYFSLEAYSCFAILMECKKGAIVVFLDLSGNLLNSWPVTGIEINPSEPCAADIDQNRRELILSSKNDMYSIALRGVVHEAVKVNIFS